MTRSCGTPTAAHSLSGTPEAVRAALAWIPNADLDYDSWVRIGLALKGALGDGGGDLFAAWSAQSGKDEPAFTAKTWDGLRPERIGAGTLYHLAMERGWKPDAALVLDGAAPQDAVHPAAGLLASIDAARTRAGARGRRRARPHAHARPAGALARSARRRARADGPAHPGYGHPAAALARRRRLARAPSAR